MSRLRLLPSAYGVAWVSALPIESAAAAEMLDEKHLNPQSSINDTDQYAFGRVGDHNVAMICLPSGQIGNNVAAAAIARITALLPSIRFALMVGIGGGVPSATSDIRLGDVVVGHPHLQHGGVVQYDFGKTGPDGQSRIGQLNAPPKVLLNAIAKLRETHYRDLSHLPKHLSIFNRLPRFSRRETDSDVLFQATYNHIGGESCKGCDKEMVIRRTERDGQEVVIHFGTIASGNQVIKDSITRDRLSNELGGVLCFEMEAAGLTSTYPCAVIRGICDYADSHKNKSWQPYAAATAAAVAKETLLLVPAADRAGILTPTRERTRTWLRLLVSGCVLLIAMLIILDGENYQVPFSLKGIPVSRFAERPEEMKRIENILMPRVREGRKALILYGLGGIGKTQLAAQFAMKHKAAFTSIFWIDGSSEESLKQGIADCASRIPERQIPEISRTSSPYKQDDYNNITHHFLGWLSNADNKHWLIILDNVDRNFWEGSDLAAYNINNYLPDADQGSVLITTRLTNLRYLGKSESLQIKNVTTNEARAIFREWYDQDFDSSDSDELLQLLHGLPLALAQAAAYMHETGASFSTYIRLYNKQWKDLMDDDNALSEVYGNRTINTTWNISFNTISKKNRGATNLLLLWAHLSNRPLPYWLFQASIKKSSTLKEELSKWLEGAANNEVEYFKLLRLLRSYCLIESQQMSSSYTIHPVVHQWAYHIQDNYQRAELSQLAIRVIGNAVPIEHTEWDLAILPQLLPHAESWIEKTERISNKGERRDEETTRAVHMVGILVYKQGKLVHAERLYRRVLDGYEEKAWVSDHTSMMGTLNNLLGLIYSKQGKTVEAAEVYQVILEVYEKVWPVRDLHHTSKFGTIGNLGLLYQQEGMLVEAERMLHRAIVGYYKELGPNHTSTLQTINNLGLLYANQGRLAEAEIMYQRVLKGFDKALGPDHEWSLITVTNLGLLYANQGRLVEAEIMYQRVLRGFNRVLGPDHGWTLSAVDNLGRLYAR